MSQAVSPVPDQAVLSTDSDADPSATFSSGELYEISDLGLFRFFICQPGVELSNVGMLSCFCLTLTFVCRIESSE